MKGGVGENTRIWANYTNCGHSAMCGSQQRI